MYVDSFDFRLEMLEAVENLFVFSPVVFRLPVFDYLLHVRALRQKQIRPSAMSKFSYRMYIQFSDIRCFFSSVVACTHDVSCRDNTHTKPVLKRRFFDVSFQASVSKPLFYVRQHFIVNLDGEWNDFLIGFALWFPIISRAPCSFYTHVTTN